ncbi:hypothetical protein MBRA1_001101 [Malassezia brasiliensis]|uniref:Uncharacterized protein n=1 Tax=Malassezia brasiliensis TaxID=1821822 RepID=A0AAF0IP44_9BASI|nr:hypothetical protein MBRA1_001101 [Malassezia brasiliensis]
MSRGPAPDASAASPRDLLQSSVGKPLRLIVSYDSFSAPNYEAHESTVVGRLWAYDQSLDVVVLETGMTGALPPALRRAAASASYEAQGRSAPQATTGFKLVQGARIVHVDILTDEEYASSHSNHTLSTVANVPVAAMEARDSAATKRSMERAQQIGPEEAGELGQAIFDALSKTSTYVPNLSREQIDKLLEGIELSPAEMSKVERAQAKANTWQRVTKVLDGVRRKLVAP